VIRCAEGCFLPTYRNTRWTLFSYQEKPLRSGGETSQMSPCCSVDDLAVADLSGAGAAVARADAEVTFVQALAVGFAGSLALMVDS
jgi:hypothetical protein